MTKEEKDFLSNLLIQITIKPSAEDAMKTVEMIQNILLFLKSDEK